MKIMTIIRKKQLKTINYWQHRLEPSSSIDEDFLGVLQM
jgi:hypothetical protein